MEVLILLINVSSILRSGELILKAIKVNKEPWYKKAVILILLSFMIVNFVSAMVIFVRNIS